MPNATSILDHKDYWDEYLPLPIQDHGLVMRRDPSGEGPRGTVKTNVPHRVERSSPDGFEFGYGGSGPLDLALNAVEHLIQTLAEEGVIDSPSDYYTEEDGDVQKGRCRKWRFSSPGRLRPNLSLRSPGQAEPSNTGS
jgi:hypothetical protein